jgi:uridine phosphorylase
LGGGRHLTDRRGLVCWEAVDAAGDTVLIVATGIGAPSTAIVVEELVDLGVHTMVRVGSCGGLQPEVKPNDLIVPTGCVRDEGTSGQYVDLAFPAVPDLRLTAALLGAVGNSGARCHAGIVHCKDAYYLEHADRQLIPEMAEQRWQAFRAANVVATEMESSILFVLGSLRRLRTGTVLIAIGASPDPDGFDHSLRVAVAAVSRVLADLPEPAQASAPRPLGARRSFLERTSE